MEDTKKAGSIKAINVASIHKICSGQVVLTLATAVKELVENSLDAGATIIEVKLKEYGSELIEVVDNGHGVRECDFESLTLKHHTSKLEDFSDLSRVATFGFRGEALSSLCALSNLVITTCHKDSSVGTRLEYDHNGAIVKTSPVSRQVGTTVSLQNLFFTLPVRHKEFHRNLRREFGKMIHLLTAYCLVCTHKRITCINHTEKGRKAVVLATSGASTVRDNITSVFGGKQVNNLKELVQRTPSESVLAEFYLSKPSVESLDTFRLKGCVSSCAHGEGRSSGDRQFFFINGRPCDLPKVSKLVNEVYHSFNKHQFPFVFLDISLEKDAVDVNVTPDKRKIFFQNEKLLLATIKSSLLSIYDQQPSIMNSSPLGIVKDNKNLGENNKFKVHFTDPKVCKSFLLSCCPHDILAATRMDLGECPKLHDLALRADYEAAAAKKDYFYDLDAQDHLQNFINECDRRTEQAKRRLAETQEELSAEVTAKLNKVHDLAEQIGKKLAQAEKLGADGNVEESMKIMEEVEDIRKKKALAEQEYRNSMPASSYQQQKLRVCEVCSAYLGIHDNDRRLADHFGGKLHLGFITIREKLEELKESISEKRQKGRVDRDRDDRARDWHRSWPESKERSRSPRRRRSRSSSREYRKHRSRSHSDERKRRSRRDRSRRSSSRDRRRSRDSDRSHHRRERSADKHIREKDKDKPRRSRSPRDRDYRRSHEDSVGREASCDD